MKFELSNKSIEDQELVEFNFNTEGDVTLKKCSENVIVLSASSSNFKFLVTGFSKISNYDVAVQDKEEQI